MRRGRDIRDRCQARYKIHLELDDKLKKGEVSEEDILDDFQELDYLEARRDELLAAMKKLQHQ